MKVFGFAALVLAVSLGGAAPAARAQVYKYKDADGTLVFTDRLSDLPPERRAYYNRKEAEAEKRRRAEERALSEQERRAVELEAERARVLAEETEAAQRRRRLAELDEALRAYRRQKAERAQRKAYWQEKRTQAETALNEALLAYRSAKKEWSGLATQAGFALFPGQQRRLQELQEALPKLAAAVETRNHYLSVTLPEEARRAGIPPGWLRE